MIGNFQGPYVFSQENVQRLDSSYKGVYYIGSPKGTGDMYPYYIGKAYGTGGIRERLLEHLKNGWTDATCFGFKPSVSAIHIDQHEVEEIKRCNPKYNTQHTR